MTTQELKQYIDKVLGNSIRCLLPSYWWKRAFGAVIDKIEDSSGVRIVGSTRELENLDVPVGSLASVAGEMQSLSECYLVHSMDELENTPFSTFTKVTGIKFSAPVTSDFMMVVGGEDCYIMFLTEAAENSLGAFLSEPISGSVETPIGHLVAIINQGEIDMDTVAAINHYIAVHDSHYLVSQGNDGYNTPALLSQIDKVIKLTGEPDAYLKGQEWTRILKEGDVKTINGESDSKSVLFYMPLNDGLSDIQKQTNAESYRKVVEGFNNNRYYDVKVDCLYCIADATIVANALLTEGRIALMFDMLNTWQVMEVLEDGSATVEEEVAGKGCEIREFYIGDSLTDEQKAWNLETAMMVEEKKCTTIFKITAPFDVLPDGTTIPLSAFVDRTFLYVFSIGVNATYVSITIDSNGNSDITVEPVSADAAMSSTSTNAVQNKVITAALNEKADKTDIKTINGVSLLGGGNLQLGDGQTIVYDDSAVYERIAEVEELAAQAKVSSELAIEELNIHLEEVNEGLFNTVTNLMKTVDDLAARVRALENK